MTAAQEPLTPEAVAGELEGQAAESVLKSRKGAFLTAASLVRERLTSAWDALTAERDHYRKTLEAIAASEGTCGEKARKALEEQP